MIIGVVTLLIGIVLGIACCPKKTGTILDGFNNYVSSFQVDENGCQGIKHAYVCKSGDIYQCLLFDKDGPNASLIGVEYVIPSYKYERLSEEERKEWQPLDHEIKSGLRVFPKHDKTESARWTYGMNSSYSKSIMLYDPVHSKFECQSLYSITKDITVSPDLIKKRDVSCNVDTAETKMERESRLTPRLPGDYSNYRGKK
jgi:hypothetical protein